MASEPGRLPEHIEGEAFERSERGENPIAQALRVTVSVPDTIEIRIVNASVLSEYEVWFFISSILGSVSTGFLVGAIQAGSALLYLNAFVWIVLLGISIRTAFSKRRILTSKSREVRLRATEIVTEGPEPGLR